MSNEKWYHRYETTGGYRGVTAVIGEGGPTVPGYRYLKFTPPPMPEPEIEDGVYFVIDYAGDPAINLKYEGGWTNSEGEHRNDPEKIIEKLSK